MVVEFFEVVVGGFRWLYCRSFLLLVTTFPDHNTMPSFS